MNRSTALVNDSMYGNCATRIRRPGQAPADAAAYPTHAEPTPEASWRPSRDVPLCVHGLALLQALFRIASLTAWVITADLSRGLRVRMRMRMRIGMQVKQYRAMSPKTYCPCQLIVTWKAEQREHALHKSCGGRLERFSCYRHDIPESFLIRTDSPLRF